MTVHFQETGLPWVTLAYAQSLDGSIAAQRGSPLILSGRQSSVVTHQLRASHQAILVGIGTILADDPQLNVRLVPGDDPQPVVLDNQLHTPLDARLFHQGKRKPWIMASNQAPREREQDLVRGGARVFRPSPGRVVLPDVLRTLAAAGVHSVMVEGGAQIITAFLRSNLVNIMVITITPVLVGGLHAVESLLVESHTAQNAQTAFPRIDPLGIERLEGDILVWGSPHWPSQPEG